MAPGGGAPSAGGGAHAPPREPNGADAAALLQRRPLRVAFVHPDLGLGGAERLIVDAAAELAARGHVVDVYTSYYDPSRCFDETRSGAFAVLVAGGWFPRAVLGRLVALCAVARCALASLYIAWRVYAGAVPPYDVVVVDQVAAAVPLLKLLLGASRVLFYCHFPDLLLTQRASPLKALYRAPLDALEQAATGAADLVLVNSRFTAGVFAATFERLAARGGGGPAVLHPAAAVPPEGELAAAAGAWEGELPPDLVELARGGPTFLSINRRGAAGARGGGGRGRAAGGGGAVGAARAPGARAPTLAPAPRARRFERKKGIGLALTALHELLQRRPGCGARLIVAGARWADRHCASAPAPALTLARPRPQTATARRAPRHLAAAACAGGYDARLAENREHLEELRALAAQLGVAERVAFVPSFTDRRARACRACRAARAWRWGDGRRRRRAGPPSAAPAPTPSPAPRRQRALLLSACRAVLYTPQHEHFGIVPLEAMAAGRAVVACDSGGPMESVPDGRGGFLCEASPGPWADALEALLDAKAAARMGAAARAHVQAAFSRAAFGERLDAHVHALANAPRR